MSEPPDENTPPDASDAGASRQAGLPVTLPVALVSASRAQDAGYLALADQALVAALDQRGYRQVAGNRFERSLPTEAAPATGPGQSLSLAIDVLVPSFTHRHLPNQEVGDLVVDAIPGLALALARPPTSIDVTVELRDPRLAEQAGLPDIFTVRVPDPISALVVKALAWASRKADRDAADVWRLLEVAAATGITPNDWDHPGARADARHVLNDSFGRRNAYGATAATSNPASRTRIASLVQQHVGRDTARG